MEKIVLEAQSREQTGKEAARRLRAGGNVPAVVYKKGRQTETIAVRQRELYLALRTSAGLNAIITLAVAGASKKKEAEKTVIIKELQRDPIHGQMLHVDFNEISLTEKIRVEVDIAVKGEAEGKKKEGVIDQIIWKLEIECLPAQIPGRIEVDVTPLDINQSLFVKDIKLDPSIQILSNPEQIVVTCSPKRELKVEEAAPVEAEVAAEAVAEPEVIGEKEREERRAAKEAAKAAEAVEKKEEKKEEGKK